MKMNRQNIVDILKNELKTIENIKNVYEWNQVNQNEKTLPVIIVRDTKSEINNFPSGTYEHSLSVEIDVIVSGKTSSQILRELMNKVLEKIGQKQKKWTCYAKFDGDEMLVEHSDYIFAGTRMKFTFKYETPSWEL